MRAVCRLKPPDGWRESPVQVDKHGYTPYCRLLSAVGGPIVPCYCILFASCVCIYREWREPGRSGSRPGCHWIRCTGHVL